MKSNLKNALNKKNITLKAFADFLDVSTKTAQNKLNGVTEFTYSEFKSVCNLLFPEYNSDYLFADNCENQIA